MSEGVVVALITGGLAVVSNIIIVVFNNSKTLYRIDQLEKKVEKHNQFIERMYSAEAHIDAIEDDIKELKGKQYV